MGAETEALSAIDETRAEILRRTLAGDLAAKGAITSPGLRSAFERAPRHRFVPRVYHRTESGRRRLVDGSNPEQKQEWLSLVYTDDSLVTQVDTNERPSSSSTQPCLMARMLELLDLDDGLTVLEIGTGTGYNAAVLCERLGSSSVTTIDVEPQLVEQARDRLRAAGYAPTVAAADGALGWPPCAPYDRILATCSVRRIPRPWIEQSLAGAMIVVNVMGGLEGGLVALTVRSDGGAEGQYEPDPAAFIRMRSSTAAAEPPLSDLVALVMETPGAARSGCIPSDFDNESFMLLAQFFLPNVKPFGTPGVSRISDGPCLVDLRDRSWARVTLPDATGSRQVLQSGEQRLWDTLESAHELWLRLGRPSRDRYGLTVRPDHSQFVWLDSPDSEHHWEL